MLDDLGREAMTSVRDALHPPTLPHGGSGWHWAAVTQPTQLLRGPLRAATQERLDAVRAEVQRIPGQRSGISFAYFLMLARSDDMVKPDRMIRRFVGRAMGFPDGS
jgi:hypothetical protein